MKTAFQKLLDFHAKFDVAPPTVEADLARRMGFLKEETREAEEAAAELLAAGPENKVKATAHLLKELADVLYVTYGTLVMLGVDGDAVFDEVHASNMSKTPRTDFNGKAIKGPDYKEADMERFVR